MLEFTSKKRFDIFSVIKVLANYNLQTCVSNQKILFEDALIPSNVLTDICALLPNYTVRNYSLTEVPKVLSEAHTELKTVDKVERTEAKYKSTVKGDVFYCDFGSPYEHEIAYNRPAIVLWNFFDRVLVLPCTTNETIYEGKFKISFKSDNFKVLDKPMSVTESMGIIGQMRVVDKTRLITKIGTLKKDTFDEIVSNIQAFFLFGVTGLSLTQFDILKLNMSKMAEIVSNESEEPISLKIDRILNLYGFNSNSNGVSYLHDAILYSINMETFNVSSLSQEVSKKLSAKVPATEVERLIIARFKDVFGKKYKTIDFIRLINVLLKEGNV